jgi:Mg2+ and Co2+ transporter CorA
VALAQVRADLKTTKRLLCIPTFMVTDVDGRVCEWGELAHHVTGIAKITDRFVDIRPVFCEAEDINDTLCTLKCAGQNDPDMVAIRVELNTFRDDMEVTEKKAFVSLKAVVSERDQEGCAKKILWIGEDLTRERDMLVQDKAEMGKACKDLFNLRTEIGEMRAKFSKMDAEKEKLCQDLAHAQRAHQHVEQKLRDSEAENQRLVQELSKFREFMSALDSLKNNLGSE